ncbi:DUF1549 and DUF1553 domain-containing protein [Novipirellula artificiosorum]|uniref:Cytochrome c domain-containing protein n=1 Tax=Novipirellula artificiosorum TaxID=2528016 RepID=A0A5C6D730_9BACT|nr:DUF1549 and DUF1553 domain-containing protein [Novipirellula artificiosorum]TWU31517.1 hypothetical protein Poly41_60730 [Novipirellula artificiosorum]
MKCIQNGNAAKLRPCLLRIGIVASVLLFALTVALAPKVSLAQQQRAPAKKQATQKPPARPKIRLPQSVRSSSTVAMQVTPVIASRRSAAVSGALRIDQLVRGPLLSNKQFPNEIASDEVFLRRVFLDVAGRIPTLTESEAFLSSSEPNRRENLIDDLLGSPDYVSNQFNFWADTLRLVDRPQPNIIAEPFLAYVKDSIRTNKPYDKWVYEMLTADGKVWENPATGFQLRDDGMPLPYIDNTVRVFLGTQVGCAQCHDHPFDEWSQYQFYQLAAYTTGVRTRIQKGSPGFEKKNPATVLIEQAKEQATDGRVSGAFQRMARANTYNVSEVKSKLRLPHDYAYYDAKPKTVVEPAVLWGEIPTSAQHSSLREQFAAWVTSPDNPQFSKTIVNRLWKRFLGVGLVEPVDDFSYEHPCINEPLMDYLCEELQWDGFDLKQLLRTILYSKTYQRTASDYDFNSGEPYYFPGPVIRRMTAEQVWDSILTLAVTNPWPFQRPTAEDLAPLVNIDFGKESYSDVLSRSERFAETYYRPAYLRTIRKHAYQGNVLCRASELPSPQSADHFLRQFGQGDRESINGADSDATVPQILAMFNGPITHVMLEEGSAIVDHVMAIDKVSERIDAIFLSLLTRRPNGADRAIAARELSQLENDNVAYGNIVWSLLNTREFLFIQ